jgi:mono/diheme cytochrome c family protein
MKLTSWVLAFLTLTVLTVIALALSGVRPKPDLGSVRLVGTAEQVERGQYLSSIAGCRNCHSDLRDSDALFAGGRAFETRFGTYYSPNITPDKRTGIGRWKRDEFVVAIQYGVSPKGAHYYPVFPYTALSNMRNEDTLAIYEYLKTVEPVSRENHRNERALFVWRNTVQLWKRLFFERKVFQPDPLKSALWNRGRYLADAVMHCGECHTPRNFIGVPDKRRYFSGDDSRSVMNASVPDITQNKETGIGYWSDRHLLHFIKSGERPDGVRVRKEVFGVAFHSMNYLSDDDAKALVEYLKTVPASH